jgi:PAS domain S-box-containing protein/putative nucleotidyltransferase with HDIG domain
MRDAHGKMIVIGAAAMARGMVEDRGDDANEAARHARSLIEMSVNPLVTINLQGKITDANVATEEATGIARDQLIGTDFADCFSEPEKARAGYQRVLEEGLLCDYPLVLRHVSGALTDVEYNATVYRDEGGELQAVFAAARDATEAQQARLQVARLAAIAASSQNARFTRDLEGMITSWNTAAEALYGYAAKEAIGRNGTILLPPGREGETQDLIKRMLRGDRGFGFETQRLCKDGSLLDVALALSPIRDAAGDITALSVISHDISRRVHAERQLRESEEKFAAAFQASPDLMAITRLSDGKLLEVNAGFTQLLGHARAEVIGTTTAELSIWADPADRATFVASLEQSGRISEFETTLRRKDGPLIVCIASAGTVEVQGETCILSVFHDVTERKRAEDMLSRYRLLAAEARDIILFVRASDGAIVEANAAAQAAYGYSREELLQLGIGDLRPARDGPTIDRQMKTAGSEGILFETEHHRKDGTVFPVEVSSRGTTMVDGQGIVLSVIRDISERKRAEQARVEGALQLRQALKAAVAALGTTTEMRDPYTAGHQRRVAELVSAIAAELSWDEGRIETLHTAALLHDIGKIVVPAEILSKPGLLSEVEMRLIRQHAVAGAETVADIDFEGDIAEMIRQHHERLDGSGYPAGLSGDAILPEARILAVADVVEAMSSHRPYRPALEIEEALEEIESGSVLRYDAEAVAVCVRLFREKGFVLGE